MKKPWVHWLLGTAVVLIAAAIVLTQLAPQYVRAQLQARLEARLDAAVDVGQVEIAYTRLAVSLHGLRLDTGRVAIDVEEIEIDWPVASLVQSDARPSVVVRRPNVRVIADRTPTGDEPAESAHLDAFEDLQIIAGTLSVGVTTNSGPTEFSLRAIEARLDNPRFGSSQMGTRVALTGRLPGQGSVSLDGQVSSTEPRLAWRARFDVQRFELAALNNLWTDIVEMDVESGTLSVHGELLRTTAFLRGRITPHFENLVMLASDEVAAHPMGEALFGHMLAGADAAIEISRALDAGSTLTFSKLLEADWKTLIADVIKRGYSRRLDTLDGYEATIGDVELDFGMGLLTLLDVRLTKDTRELDVPFVSVPRIDVVFDEQVTQRDATAYKHVTLWEPTVTFIAGQTGAQSQIKFDDRWVDKISALPFKTRDLVVHGGRVEYRDDRYAEPVDFFVGDIELVGRDMAAGMHPAGQRGAYLTGSGRIMGIGNATIAVIYEPRAAEPNIDLDLFMPPLPLDILNPVLRTYAQVQAASGSLGFSAHITARRLHVDASVVPTVVAPELLRVEGGRHALRHVMIERRLQKLRGRAIDLSFELEPDQGVLHEFFPQFLIAAMRER